MTVGRHDELLRREIPVQAWQWVGAAPEPDAELLVQTRAHGAPVAGRVQPGGVHLSEPTPRVAAGQVVALYDGDVLVGGAIAA